MQPAHARSNPSATLGVSTDRQPPWRHTATMRTAPVRRWLARASCALWGHHVDNHVFERASTRARRCRCGAAYLPEDGGVTRVRHTLSCFLGHHTYERLIDRHGCHEYVCVQCGHPLLFRADADPYAAERQICQEGPLSLRTVWSPRSRGGNTRRLRRVCMPLRAFVSEI